MDEGIVKQIVDELLSSMEPIETQSGALMQFLKAKGLATDEELAPFLEQAGNAANVRWRAVRVRTAALISNAMKPADQDVQKTPATQSRTALSHESNETPPTKDAPAEQESGREETQKGQASSETEERSAANATTKSKRTIPESQKNNYDNAMQPENEAGAPKATTAAAKKDVQAHENAA